MFKPTIVYHPWEDILEAITAKWWTQKQFAEIIGISKPALNAIIKWHRNIIPNLAVRIGFALWTSTQVRMNLQTMYDIHIAKKQEKNRIQNVKNKLKELRLA